MRRVCWQDVIPVGRDHPGNVWWQLPTKFPNAHCSDRRGHKKTHNFLWVRGTNRTKPYDL